MPKFKFQDELATWILANQMTAVLLFNSDLHLTYLNPAAEVLLSVSSRMVAGLSAEAVLRCTHDKVEATMQTVLNTQQPITEREVGLLTAEGRTITVDCTLLPLEHRRQGAMVLMEMRQVDQQLRLTREEQLIAQNSATRELIRGLAHEIKNPLGGLRGAAQMLEMEYQDSEIAEYANIIISEADRLTSLVDQMLGSRQPPVRRALNIHHLIEHVCSVVASDTQVNNEFRRDYDPSIPEMHGDWNQLVQAILNILNNAVQATGGKGVVTIQTRVLRQFALANRRYRLVARIRIIDNGPGIPEELQQQVFYPMVTGKPEGTGLGLSIAQSIVNRHRGLIEFTSRPGLTIFTIYLPLDSTHE